jgi:peroxiredoxin
MKSIYSALLSLCIVLCAGCGEDDPHGAPPVTGGDVGDMAPSVTLRGLDGADLSLEALRGEVLVLCVWAESCAGCLGPGGDLEEMSALAAGYPPTSGVRVMAPDFADPVWRLREIEDEGNYRVPFFYDAGGNFAEAFEITELPTVISFVIDGEGVVRYRAPGIDLEKLDAAIKEFAG